MPNTKNIWQILIELRQFADPIASVISRLTKRRTPLEKLADEETRYRRRYSRGKIDDQQLETLLQSIAKRRQELAAG